MYHVSKKLTILFLTMALLLAASLACGGETVSPTAEQAQAHPTATSAATSIPEPTSITPASVPGIDEPLTVADVEIQVLEAYTVDSLSAGESPVYPDDPSDTFFEVVVDIGGGGNAFDWVASNIRLAYEGEEYEMVRYGIKYGEDGKFVGTIFVFSVPKGSEFAGYALQLTDEASIALASFFE